MALRVPESLFVLINPVVRALLRSPLHWPMSRSLMLITFTGRRSGRAYTTPVRYLRKGDAVRCFTGSEARWWRNLQGGADVVLRITGADYPYRAEVLERRPELVREALQEYFERFPQDAVYHDVRLNSDGRPDSSDLDKATGNAIVVEARPR